MNVSEKWTPKACRLMYDLALGDLSKSLPFVTPVPCSIREGAGLDDLQGPYTPPRSCSSDSMPKGEGTHLKPDFKIPTSSLTLLDFLPDSAKTLLK